MVKVITLPKDFQNTEKETKDLKVPIKLHDVECNGCCSGCYFCVDPIHFTNNGEKPDESLVKKYK